MIEISCCMIVKNEERILARCLDSIADMMDYCRHRFHRRHKGDCGAVYGQNL